MKKFFGTGYSDFSFNVSMFLLRAGFGSLLFINYGWFKLMHFTQMKDRFSDPLHIGQTTSLVLVIFAEIFCTALIVLGLFSRFAALVLVILFGVIVFIVLKGKPIKDLELPLLFLFAFCTTLFCGPGKWSLDKLIGK
ncbi:MAG: DoxX family protein [Chitinophagales bacterium]